MLIASYDTDGLDSIIKLIASENPNIVTLQETQSNAAHDQVREIAAALGYTYVHDITSESHIDEGYKLGHGILSRYPITDQVFGLFDNPNLKVTWEDGSIATSFDKGFTTCTLDTPGGALTVTTLHLIPFRRFDVDMGSGLAKKILGNVEDLVAGNYSPWLIQGDFNINSQLLENYLPKLFDQNTGELLIDRPTNPKGRSYDHIIFRGAKLIDYKIVSNVLTDHFPVIARFEI